MLLSRIAGASVSRCSISSRIARKAIITSSILAITRSPGTTSTTTITTKIPADTATFTSAGHALHKGQTNLPSRPAPPPDSELDEKFLKGSGPGGQKINKTNSAVQLKHIPTGIVVKCQATRSREQNRKIARRELAEELDNLRNGDQSREALVGALKKKRADSAAKKKKRKYRLLEEEKKEKEEEKEEKEEKEEGAKIEVG